MKRLIIALLSVLSVFALGVTASAAAAGVNNIANGAGNAVEGVVEGAGDVVGGAVNGVGRAAEGVIEGAEDAAGIGNDTDKNNITRDDLPNDNTTERGVLGATTTNPATAVSVADMMVVVSALGLAGVAVSIKKRK